MVRQMSKRVRRHEIRGDVDDAGRRVCGSKTRRRRRGIETVRRSLSNMGKLLFSGIRSEVATLPDLGTIHVDNPNF